MVICHEGFDPMQIIISDTAYRMIAATGRVFQSVGVKLEDGSWSVLVDAEVMTRISNARHAGETHGDTLMRLLDVPCGIA